MRLRSLAIAAFVAAAACASSGCLTTPASETGWTRRIRDAVPRACSSAEALIEDGEDGDNRALVRPDGRGGYWFTSVNPEGSTIEPSGTFKMSSPGYNGSKFSAHMHGLMATTGTSVYASMGFSLADPRGGYDASQYSGVSFWAKGPAHVRFEIPDTYTDPSGGICKDCYNDFGVELAFTGEWKRYTIPFEWLAQRPGWGEPRPELSRNQLMALEWQFGTPGREYDVAVDDITFICGVEGGTVSTQRLARSGLLALALGGLALVGCGGTTDKPRPQKDFAAAACVPITLSGADDLGGQPPECGALADYELSEIEYFRNGAATGWYINGDRTALMEPAADTDPVPAVEIPGGLCPDDPAGSRFALHLRTGVLSDFGATFGSNLKRRTIDTSTGQACPVTPCANRAVTPPPQGPCGVGQGVPGQGAINGGPCQTGQDASAWQGIVFWGRVGPGSANAVRIQVGNPTTDDSNQACVCTSFTDQNDVSAGCDKYGSFAVLDDTWRPYLVPFDGMLQAGWGISDPRLDTSQLFSLAFNLGRDQWDLWISHIAFYRSLP